MTIEMSAAIILRCLYTQESIINRLSSRHRVDGDNAMDIDLHVAMPRIYRDVGDTISRKLHEAIETKAYAVAPPTVVHLGQMMKALASRRSCGGAACCVALTSAQVSVTMFFMLVISRSTNAQQRSAAPAPLFTLTAWLFMLTRIALCLFRPHMCRSSAVGAASHAPRDHCHSWRRRLAKMRRHQDETSQAAGRCK